jgi:uncharacterized protein YjbJ (UPF0337 family)
VSGKSDQATGRVKKAAGALTGNNKLQRRGKLQETKGKVKETIDRGAKKIEKAVDRHTS